MATKTTHKFVDSVQNKDFTNAKAHFNTAMAEKINSAFEKKKIELASKMTESAQAAMTENSNIKSGDIIRVKKDGGDYSDMVGKVTGVESGNYLIRPFGADPKKNSDVIVQDANRLIKQN